MALSRVATSVIPTASYQLARASPVLLGNVHSTFRYTNSSIPTVQKRTFIVGTIINCSLDLLVFTTGFAGIRRVSGFDMRQYVDRLSDPRWRSYLYRYLDFGEVCADKIVNFFQRNVSEKDKAEYHEYMREQENRRNLNHQCDHDYYRDSHNRRYSVVCYSFPCLRIHEERLLVDSTGLLCWWNHDSLELN